MPNVIGPFSVLTTSMAPLEGYMARLRHLTSPRIFARYEDGSVEVAISRYRRPMPTEAASKAFPLQNLRQGRIMRASRWKPPATPHGRLCHLTKRLPVRVRTQTGAAQPAEPAPGSHHRASRWKPPATPHGRPPHEAPACACPHADRRRPLSTHQPRTGDRTIRITQPHTRQYLAILIHLEPPVCHVLPS